MPTFIIVEAATQYIEYEVTANDWEEAKEKFANSEGYRNMGNYQDFIDTELVEIIDQDTQERVWSRDDEER